MCPCRCLRQQDHLIPASGVVHRYYVKTCAKPQKRAALALAIKIGSAVEQDDEQGVAHIVEHLAFNATEVGPRNYMYSVIPYGMPATRQNVDFASHHAKREMQSSCKIDRM